MGVFSEFREFIARGNVIDLAVGVIIGAAFNDIVKSLVDQIIMPPIGLMLSGLDFSKLSWVLKADNPHLDVVRLTAIEAIVGRLAKSTLDHVGLAAQAIGFTIRQDVAAVELDDLALDLVEANLKQPNVAVLVAVAIAIGSTVLRLIILRGSRRGDRQSGRGEDS